MENTSDHSRAWRRLIERAQADTVFLGRALRAYCEAHALSDEELRSWLRCPSDEALDRLSLCRIPDEQPEALAREARQISDHASCDPDRLVQLLREVAALEAVREATVPPESQTLLAARDRRGDDDDGDDTETDRE